jgi:hypothetical protein
MIFDLTNLLLMTAKLIAVLGAPTILITGTGAGAAACGDDDSSNFSLPQPAL